MRLIYRYKMYEAPSNIREQCILLLHCTLYTDWRNVNHKTWIGDEKRKNSSVKAIGICERFNVWRHILNRLSVKTIKMMTTSLSFASLSYSFRLNQEIHTSFAISFINQEKTLCCCDWQSHGWIHAIESNI